MPGLRDAFRREDENRAAEATREHAEEQRRRQIARREELDKQQKDARIAALHRQAEEQYRRGSGVSFLGQIAERKGGERIYDPSGPDSHHAVRWFEAESIELQNEYTGDTHTVSRRVEKQVDIRTDSDGRTWVNGRRVRGGRWGLERAVAKAYQHPRSGTKGVLASSDQTF